MVAQATEFETMRVLHNLWSKNLIYTAQVIVTLQQSKQLQVTSLTLGGMTAESFDGRQKYNLNR